MTKLETVLKGLNCCAEMEGDACHECPYGSECRDTDLPYGIPHLADDAFKLINALWSEVSAVKSCQTCAYRDFKYCNPNAESDSEAQRRWRECCGTLKMRWEWRGDQTSCDQKKQF